MAVDAAKASSPPLDISVSVVCPSPPSRRFVVSEVVADGEGEESGLKAPPCCAGVECRERANEGCRKKLPCGHPCRGPGEAQLQQLRHDLTKCKRTKPAVLLVV